MFGSMMLPFRTQGPPRPPMRGGMRGAMGGVPRMPIRGGFIPGPAPIRPPYPG